MTRITLLNVYAMDDDLPERIGRYHILVALRKLKRAFRNNLQRTWISDLRDADYQIVDWLNYEAELTEFSKQLPCVRLFVRKCDSFELTNGVKL